MIQSEIKDGFIRQFSDENKYIKKVGTNEKYRDAVDIYPTENTYIETDEPIPIPTLTAEEKLIELGVDPNE